MCCWCSCLAWLLGGDGDKDVLPAWLLGGDGDGDVLPAWLLGGDGDGDVLPAWLLVLCLTHLSCPT